MIDTTLATHEDISDIVGGEVVELLHQRELMCRLLA
jgi:hypothetical protein